MWSSSEE
jgi:hypothetical protein